MRYEDENIWLTQRMPRLYDMVSRNYQHQKIFADHELQPEATIKKYFS